MRTALLALLLGFGCSLGCSSGGRGTGNGDGPGAGDMGLDVDAYWAQDPPPMFCTLDGGALPPPPIPGGTIDCPDDKNREGCPCPTLGMTAACWPGLRV